MPFSKSNIAETLIEGYIKTPLPLSEQMLMNIALRVCHNLNLKQEIFSPNLDIANTCSPEQVRNKWEKHLKKQSTEICKTLFLPHRLQEELISLIRSIALQLLIWSGQWKETFDISCDFTVHCWMPTHFTEGRIDERKIAECLMQDDRLSIDQRYMLACVYCLEEFIPLLWHQIPLEQRDLYVLDDHHEVQKSEIVQVWSDYMTDPELFLTKEHLFWAIFSQALLERQTTAAIFSWNKLSSRTKHSKLKIAFNSITDVRNISKGNSQVLPFMNDFRIQLPPPSGQGYITCFLLSQICEHKLEGYEAKLKSCEYMIEYFLNWPS